MITPHARRTGTARPAPPVSCPTCLGRAETALDKARLREELLTAWWSVDPLRPEAMKISRHCGDCQPHQACLECCDGPRSSPVNSPQPRSTATSETRRRNSRSSWLMRSKRRRARSTGKPTAEPPVGPRHSRPIRQECLLDCTLHNICYRCARRPGVLAADGSLQGVVVRLRYCCVPLRVSVAPPGASRVRSGRY